MDEVLTRRIEAMVDLGSAAALGAATAWACLHLGLGPPAASAAGALAFGAAFVVLCRVPPRAMDFPVASFVPAEIAAAELVLGEADRADRQELLLDDALAPPDADSRVVRLFDASAMPTPGELKSRIDRHLARPQSAPPDASQALFDALAELRGSLR